MMSNYKAGKRIASLAIVLILLLGLLPTAALAGGGVSVSGMTVTHSGTDAGTSVAAHTAYQVQIELKNNNTYSVSPSVTLYEVRSGQPDSIIDETQPAGDLEADGQKTLSFVWTPEVAGSCTLKAVVSEVIEGMETQLDLTEHSVTVTPAVDPVAIDKLQAYYMRVGAATPLSALGMRALTDDPELNGAVFKTPYDGSQSYYTLNYGSAVGFAALDQMAMGRNPRSYEKNIAGTTNTVPYDLIAALMDSVKADGSFQYSTKTMPGLYPGATELYSILALEMYYGGANWAKAGGNEKQSRIGAIETFLGYFKDSVKIDGTATTNWSVTDGGSYGRYYCSGNIPAFAGIQTPLPMQLDTVILLSRWLDDETLVTVGNRQPEPLKDVAEREINGILKTYTLIYNGAITTGASATQKNNLNKAVKGSSANLAGFVSALIAAGHKDMVDTLGLIDQLNQCQIDKNDPENVGGDLAQLTLRDGAYRNSLSAAGYSDMGTARAAIALADYMSGRSIMAALTYDLTLSDADTVAWDLNALSIADTVTANLTLPASGIYGSAINWESSNSAAIDPATGVVSRSGQGDGDIDVKLTATAVFGSASDIREFFVTVPAVLSGDQESVNADIKALTLPVFTTDNIALPSAGSNGCAITWKSSDVGIISTDGAVMKTGEERKATLTATVTNGETSGQKEFVVTVGKNVADDDIVTKAAYQMRAYYETHRSLTSGYWDVWAAKAVVGDDFDRYHFSLYNVRNHRTDSAWKGTDYGGVILQVLAQGDNPYNYHGVNYVEAMLAYVNRPIGSDPYTWGGFGEPIFLAMALDATGEMTPDMFQSVKGILKGQFNLNYGPDLGGWAMAPLANHLNDSDDLKADITASFDGFKNLCLTALDSDPASASYKLISKGFGAENWSYPLSNNSVLIGSVGAKKAGYDGFDLMNNTQWLQGDGSGIVNVLYDTTFKNQSGPYNAQIAIGFGDLYRGENIWTSVGISHEKLLELLAAVKPVAEGGGAAYTASSFAALLAAYDAADVYKGTACGYGKAYFTLRDAYEGLNPAGSISVQVLGDARCETVFDTAYVYGTGSALQLLQQTAKANHFTQTVSGGKIIEIGGLKAEGGAAWRVYNGQSRITDLNAPIAEGSALVYKYCGDSAALNSSATLDEHLVHDTALALIIGGADNGIVGGAAVTLLKSGLFGTGVSWISNKPLTINPDTGAVTAGTQNIRVTLTATVSGPEGATLSATFELVVKGTGSTTPEKHYAWISVTDPNPPAGHPSVYFVKQKLEIEPGETAFTILEKTGLNLRVNRNTQYGVYVEAINGYGEFDGGNLSGWVCKLNGIGIMVSSALVPIGDGDTVEWLYTRDLGEDVGIDMPGGGGKDGSEAATLAPKVTATNGMAAVVVQSYDLIGAIGSAKENGSTAIVIAPEFTGAVKKATVELEKNAFSLVASSTDVALTVQTPVGAVTLPNAALDSIASQASGSTVTISLGTVDNATLTANQQKAVGTSTVYDISVLSDSAKISSFGGNSISISLPYTLRDGESASGVTVWYMDDSGKLQPMTATYDKTTGMTTFSTTHLSYYLVGYTTAWTNPFGDVKSTDWFYDAVKYISQSSLMSGTSATAFEPNSNMTRAMLVTVLYHLEGTPAITGTNGFTDVKPDEWYTDAVIWVSTNKIVGGYGGGLFGTNDNVTREQMATILMNYATYKKYDNTKTTELKTYTDMSSINSWATASTKWAVAEGLITGTSTTTLSPTGTASRAQVATIFMRFIENVTK